jgi:hypothetical protein
MRNFETLENARLCYNQVIERKLKIDVCKLDITEEVKDIVNTFVVNTRKQYVIDPWEIIWINIHPDEREGKSCFENKNFLEGKMRIRNKLYR